MRRRTLLAILALVAVLLVGGTVYAAARHSKPAPIACEADEAPHYSAPAHQQVCMFMADPDYLAQADWLMASPHIKIGQAELMGPDAHLNFMDTGVELDPSGQSNDLYLGIDVCNTGDNTVTQFTPTHLLLDAAGPQAVFDYGYGVLTKFQPKLVGHHEIWPIYPSKCIHLRVLPAAGTRGVLMVYAGPNGVPISNQAILLNPMPNP